MIILSIPFDYAGLATRANRLENSERIIAPSEMYLPENFNDHFVPRFPQ